MILQAPDGYPLLAQWQYGLGRSAAWMSDLKGQWGRDLVRWPQFGTLAAQLVAWTVPRQDSGQISASAQVAGLAAEITAQLTDSQGQPLTAAAVQGTLIDSAGQSTAITLRQTAPGQYQATLPSPPTGAYLIQLAAAVDGQPVAAQTVGLVVPYSPEYRQREANPALLTALADVTGGQLLTTPAPVFRHDQAAVRRAREIGLPLLVLALLLLPLDVAVRRLGLRRRDLAALRARLPGRGAAPAAAATPMLGNLQRAKSRAQTKPRPAADEPAPPTAPQLPRRPRPVVERPTREETAPPADTGDAMARLRAARDRARREQER